LEYRPLMKQFGSEPYPWEADVFDAKEAIRGGHDQPLASYLRDAAKGAKLIAQIADPIEGDAPKLKLLPAKNKKLDGAHDELVEDWDGTARRCRFSTNPSHAGGWCSPVPRWRHSSIRHDIRLAGASARWLESFKQKGQTP
jgi:hypothetical protein